MRKYLIALLLLTVVPNAAQAQQTGTDATPPATNQEHVTVHGQASPELAVALDAYLGSLPRYVAPVALETAADGQAPRPMPPQLPPPAQAPRGI